MSNINAAIGRVQLSKFEFLASKRKELATEYVKKLQRIDNVFPIIQNFEDLVPHIFVVKIPKLRNRNGLRAKLLNEFDIQTGVHYQPNHKLAYFKENSVQPKLPNLEQIYPTILTLPLHPNLEIMDVGKVVYALEKSLPEFSHN